LQAKFSGFRDKSEAFLKKHQKSFGIKELNRILKVVVGAMVVVFVVGFIADLMGLRQDFAESIHVPSGKMFEMEPPKEGAPGEASVEQWDLGKMFMPYGKRQEEAEKIQKEQSTRLADLTKKLKLTGISYNPADAKSAFCMIEDVEKSITTFLREGDPIGMLKVQKIYEDRVVLEQGNETIEIR